MSTPPSAAAMQKLIDSDPNTVNTYMASFSNEEIKKWDLRSDLLYHFHAYRYFNREFSDTAVDLVNLDDADVQYYNRVADMTRGLNNSYKLALYLENFELKVTVEAANTHRKRLVCHVREYNFGTEARRRFFMVNLSQEEIELLQQLSPLTVPLSVGSSVSTEVFEHGIEHGNQAVVVNGESEVVNLLVGSSIGIVIHEPDEDFVIKNENAVIDNGQSSSVSTEVRQPAGQGVAVKKGHLRARHTTIGKGKNESITVVKQKTANTTTFTIPSIIVTSPDNKLVWATDGCTDIHAPHRTEVEERKMEELIQESLAKYWAKRASEPVPGDGHGTALKFEREPDK